MQLKLNSDITEYIQFASTKHIEKLDTSPFNANSNLIESSIVVRYLEGYLNRSLKFKDHIKKNHRSNGQLQRNKVNMKIPHSRCSHNYTAHALHISHGLCKCNAVQCTRKKLNKYQTIQNICSKIALKKSKYSSFTEALKTLYWPPIQQWIQYKILTLMFKCIHYMTPGYHGGTYHHWAKCKRTHEVQQQGNNKQNTKSQKGNICCQGILIFSTNIVEWINKVHQGPYIVLCLHIACSFLAQML